jgi:hypothetical protein
VVKIASGAVGAVACGLAWWYQSEDAITAAMVKAFENGSAYTAVERPAKVERESLHEDLLNKVVAPPSQETTYAVVVGEQGVGKSTAIQQVVSKLKKPRGAVYVATRAHGRDALVQDLVRVLGFRKPFSFWEFLLHMDAAATDDARIEALSNDLEAKLIVVGQAYYQKYKRVPVLILDAVDIIHKQQPEFLVKLQTLAKTGADKNALRVVFVMSEHSGVDSLRNHSHSSRMTIVVVGDVPDEKARVFLHDSGVPASEAADAVARITGGRLELLNRYVKLRTYGETNDEIFTDLASKTARLLSEAKLPKTNPLFRALLAGPVLSADAHGLVGQQTLESLVEKNIVSIDIKSQAVSFNSRHVQVFAKLEEEKQQRKEKQLEEEKQQRKEKQQR